MGISRARTRVGRRVRYLPTDVEIAATGDGPYVGQITAVDDATGAATLLVTNPDGTTSVVTDAIVGNSGGTYDFFGGVTP